MSFLFQDASAELEWTKETGLSVLTPIQELLTATVIPEKILAAVVGQRHTISHGIGRVGSLNSTETDNVNTHISIDSDDDCDGEDEDEGDDIDQTPQTRLLTVVEINECAKRAYDDCVFGSPSCPDFHSAATDLQPFVLVQVSLDKPLAELVIRATVNEVSRLFRYDEEQHRAFAIGARAFLRLLECEGYCDTQSTEEVAEIQRLLFLHGMAGTGKSHVIRGWTALSVSWTRPKAIGLFAITGVAAANIGGSTFARLVFSFTRWGMTDNLRKRWGGLRVAVWDEVSMATCTDVATLDAFGRALTGRENLPFGGITLIIAGDFFQLPPPVSGGRYLFQDPGQSIHARLNGYRLYRSFKDVVVLTKVIGFPFMIHSPRRLLATNLLA